jgi:serine O-acetyltransferase
MMAAKAKGRASARRSSPKATIQGAPSGVAEALSTASALFPAPPPGGVARRPLPSRVAVAAIVEDVRAVLFPGHFGGGPVASGPAAVAQRLTRIQRALRKQVWRGLAFSCEHGSVRGRCVPCAHWAEEITGAFLERLPPVRALLESDVRAAFDGDPAATFIDETLLCYPGVMAIAQHRIAHELHRLGVPLVPRMIAELSRASTGIDIHPGARIGPSFFIDHGTGVVIGETCSIGAHVRIYQGVTLGARGFPHDEAGVPVKGLPRHPIVGDGVVIYAGATILGRITIGRGATIGGNVWLTRDVAPGARVTQAQARPPAFAAP